MSLQILIDQCGQRKEDPGFSLAYDHKILPHTLQIIHISRHEMELQKTISPAFLDKQTIIQLSEYLYIY